MPIKIFLPLFSFLLGCSLFAPSYAAAADANEDGLGDFWQLLYRAEGLAETGDEDGDSATNGEESAAGTDPFDSDSVLTARVVEVAHDMSTVTWRSIELWEYQLQSRLVEGEDVWEDEGDRIAGTGGEMTVMIPDERLVGRELRLSAGLPGDLPQVDMTSALGTHDSDGDGDTDLAEYLAGTSPHDAESYLTVVGGGDLSVIVIELTTQRGKKYQREELREQTWTAVGEPFDGRDGNILRTIWIDQTSRLVRFRAIDNDWDGDLATDWEELRAGSDPFRKSSALGFANDAEWIASLAAEPAIVTLDAAAGVVSTGRGQNGMIRILREGNPRRLTVNLSFSGDAIAGVDYASLPDTVELAGGVMELEIPILPVSPAGADLVKSLDITLEPGDYTSGEVVQSGARIVNDSLLNVRDYGATGDGETDDTVAIQAALDAFATNPQFSRLHFPTGRYRLDTAVPDPETRSNLYRILELHGEGLDGRDLLFTGDEGAVLFSTVSPLRANMLVVRARMRSLRFEGLVWEKDPEPLAESVGSEPNRAAGVTMVLHGEGRIDFLDFHRCKFLNCHGAVSFYGAGYDIRGRLANFRVTECETLNPYGSNTINGLSAFGGGQQFYLPPWVGRAVYRDSVFEGGSSDMTDSTFSPGGRLKDGGHFGSPMELIFERNVVRRMGVEALFQTSQLTLMGATDSAFEMPEADGVSTVTIPMYPVRSSFNSGDVLIMRTEWTGASAGASNVMNVEAADNELGTLTLSNPGDPRNQAAGTLIPTRVTVYLDNDFDQAPARIHNNYFDGTIPPGSTPPAAISGIVAVAKADIRANLVVGYGRGIYINRDVHAILHPANRGSVVAQNIIYTRDPALTLSYTYGVDSWGLDDRVEGNFILTEFPRKTFGVHMAGTQTMSINNHVVSTEIFRNGYTSGNRAVAVGSYNTGIRTEAIGNWTRGFDVGMGGVRPQQSIPHIVRDHKSLDDEIGADPVGAFTEWP